MKAITLMTDTTDHSQLPETLFKLTPFLQRCSLSLQSKQKVKSSKSVTSVYIPHFWNIPFYTEHLYYNFHSI
jgi:hypothetical protein